MSYVFFSLLAAFSWAMGTLSSKIASKHTIKNWDQLLVFFYATYNPLPLLIVPLVALPHSPGLALAPIFFNALFFFLGAIFFFKSLLTIDASAAAPLYQVQGATIALLAFIFLGERFPLISYLWLLLIMFGSILVSIDERLHLSAFLDAKVLLMILANILFGISNLFTGIALKYTDTWNTLFWTPIFTSLLVILFITYKRPQLKIHIKKISPMFSAGIFQFIGSVSMITAFTQNLTISGILSLLSSPIIFVIAILTSSFFPQLLEHHSRKVYAIRGTGLLLILFAAVKISLGT